MITVVLTGVWLLLRSIATQWSLVVSVKHLLEGKTSATAPKLPHLLHKESHLETIM